MTRVQPLQDTAVLYVPAGEASIDTRKLTMRLQVCKLPLQSYAVGGQPNSAQPRQGMQLLCEWDDVWSERGLSACEADLINTSLYTQPGLQ